MTNIIVIDGSKALELIDAAVEERGENWVYPDTGQCRYFYDPRDYPLDDYDEDNEPITKEEQAMVDFFGTDAVKPACLVGCAVHALDERLDSYLMANNDQSVDGFMSPLDDNGNFQIAVEGGVEFVFTHEAHVIFQAGQSAQDSGLIWGEARLRARAAAERLGVI